MASLDGAARRKPVSADQASARISHLKVISGIGEKLPASIPPPLKIELQNWASRFKEVIERGDDIVRQSLVKFADTKASKLEAAHKRDRMNSWRAAVGATVDEKGSKAPSRLAYRWLRGLT